MPTVFVFQNHVSWQEIFQRLPRPVQRLCAMLETPRHIFGPSDVKFFTWWTTLCKGIPRRSAANFQARFPSGQMMLEPVILSRQPQTSVSFLRNFTWTLLHAPPHPTPTHPTCAYMHLPATTDKHVLPPQVHMNKITCPTPPHPCIHAPTGSHGQACPSSASSHGCYYMPQPTPPHPPDVYKTPRPSKGRGPTIYIYMYIHIC